MATSQTQQQILPALLPKEQFNVSQSSLSVATISSCLFGSVTGKEFNDVDAIDDIVISKSERATIDMNYPMSRIVVRHGAVVDGVYITYNLTDNQPQMTVEHGTNHTCTDNSLRRTEINLSADEEIVAVCGRSGQDQVYGLRICSLGFMIWNRSTAKIRMEGPYGGNAGQPFRVTANGAFVGFGGYAVDTNQSLGQNRDGGLFGLKLIDIAYRRV